MNNIVTMSKLVQHPSQSIVNTAIAAPKIVGVSKAMEKLNKTLERVARSSVTVLINGETGTGKELAARAVHCYSARAHKAFIAINTAAIPKDLLESELFGHEKGAFTGAYTRRSGRFEQADGGTLFLDEIGDMPIELQVRLLRVLEDGVFYPVGSHNQIRVDVRIITATHQNLEQRVADGLFREDLFHRLNVIRIRMPPLRERKEDIPLLLTHYLQKAGLAMGEDCKQLSPKVEGFLAKFYWPGNIRQLENLCHWLATMTDDTTVFMSDLPTELFELETQIKNEQWQQALMHWTELQLIAGNNNIAKIAQLYLEKVLIETVLENSNGYRNLAAKRLGYGRNTLTRKIQELGLFS